MQLCKKALSMAMGGALCLSAATQVNADSLLAPLVVSDAALGLETFLALKVEGNGTPDAQFGVTNTLHYYWYEFLDLGGPTQGQNTCPESNTTGLVSPWDMVFQSVGSASGTNVQVPAGDQSAAQFVPGPFTGFMILDDEVGGVSVANEGNFSGFAYIVNLGTGDIAEYKLLNNHLSTDSGDFSAGFISKKAADFSWWPTNVMTTAWVVLAVGNSMTGNPAWGGVVDINQQGGATLGGIPKAQIPFAGLGAYDNDERVWSGDPPVNIVCMDIIDRTDLLTGFQQVGTANGGWTRKALVGSAGANGAIVLKIETLVGGAGTTNLMLTVETAGHLGVNDDPGTVVNRPY